MRYIILSQGCIVYSTSQSLRGCINLDALCPFYMPSETIMRYPGNTEYLAVIVDKSVYRRLIDNETRVHKQLKFSNID